MLIKLFKKECSHDVLIGSTCSSGKDVTTDEMIFAKEGGEEGVGVKGMKMVWLDS